MKKVIIIIFVFFMGILSCKAIGASGYIVLDQDTNNVIEGRNIHNQRLIASISKIMTCVIAIENGNLEEEIIVTNDILKAVGSSIYIEVGEKITLRNLLYGMMLRSGNDASLMIAKTISGNIDDFTKLMNDYAKKIGMNNTVFYNSNGLENDEGLGNLSTPYDMAILTSYAMKNKTFRKIFKTRKYVAKSSKKTYEWQNKNKLLKYDYITGGKTGYTIKAKRTLVTTATINKMNLIIVTLNDSNDWNDHLELYEKIKNNYQKIKILDKKSFNIKEDRRYLKDTLFINHNYSLIIKNENINKLKIKYYLSKNDYHNNDKVGTATIYLDQEAIYNEPIYVHVEKQNFYRKIKIMFKKIKQNI